MLLKSTASITLPKPCCSWGKNCGLGQQLLGVPPSSSGSCLPGPPPCESSSTPSPPPPRSDPQSPARPPSPCGGGRCAGKGCSCPAPRCHTGFTCISAPSRSTQTQQTHSHEISHFSLIQREFGCPPYSQSTPAKQLPPLQRPGTWAMHALTAEMIHFSNRAPTLGPQAFPSQLLVLVFAGDAPPPRCRGCPSTTTAKPPPSAEPFAGAQLLWRSIYSFILSSQPETRHLEEKKPKPVSIKGLFKRRAENGDQAEKHNKPEAISLEVGLKGT